MVCWEFPWTGPPYIHRAFKQKDRYRASKQRVESVARMGAASWLDDAGETGKRIRIKRLIGTGAFADVYLASVQRGEESPKQEVALKVMLVEGPAKPGCSNDALFISEGQSLMRMARWVLLGPDQTWKGHALGAGTQSSADPVLVQLPAAGWGLSPHPRCCSRPQRAFAAFHRAPCPCQGTHGTLRLHTA